MRILPFILLPGLLLPALGCGAEADGEPQAVNPPVAVWRPDSTRATPTLADSSIQADGSNVVAGGPGARPADAPAAEPAGGDSEAAAAAPAAAPPAAATPPAGGAEDATAILLRAERAYDDVRTLRADFTQDLTVPLLESTQRSRGEVFHRKPDRFLMRFSDPAGDIVVADGQYLWLYYPSTDAKQVVRTSMGQAGRLDLQREFLSNPTERFHATLNGSASVAGRPAKALTLVPRGQSPYRRVRIWIDDRDSLARRFEITENNDAVRVVELANLRANVPLQDELFSFEPPAGAQVFDQ